MKKCLKCGVNNQRYRVLFEGAYCKDCVDGVPTRERSWYKEKIAAEKVRKEAKKAKVFRRKAVKIIEKAVKSPKKVKLCNKCRCGLTKDNTYPVKGGKLDWYCKWCRIEVNKENRDRVKNAGLKKGIKLILKHLLHSDDNYKIR
ncbi:MAG: hypothetical protein WC055_02010 [Melioribacteraceae bacterium]